MITNPLRQVNARDRLYGLMASGQIDPTICSHIHLANNVKCNSIGCEDCLRDNIDYLNIRICLICGHVGCCDDSPARHATKHFEETGHPLVQSFNPGETWVYCYLDDAIVTN